jgi:hypothetical protein
VLGPVCAASTCANCRRGVTAAVAAANTSGAWMQDAEQALYESRQRVLEAMARASTLEADVKREAAINARAMRMQAQSTR